MQWIWRAFGQEPRLEAWEGRPFSVGVEAGPRSGDRLDAYERIIGCEEPGSPAPAGVHRRAAEAILSYRIFPPALVQAVLRRQPVAVGDTVGVCYHLVPGLDLFFAARVLECFDEPG